MNMRYWIMLSIALHLVLLIALYFMPPIKQARANTLIPVSIVQLPENIIEPQPTLPRVIPKTKIDPPLPKPKVGTTLIKPGVKKSKDTNGKSMQAENQSAPGPGNKKTAAPDVMRVKTGTNWPAPPGDPEGTGTGGGKGLGPSGPTYGAAAQGGPVPTYPKLAEAERIGGTVIVRLQVSAQSAVQSVSLSQSSGNDHLDQAALKAARNWRVSAAMNKGQATAGSTRIRFTFIDGHVSAEVLKD